LITDKGFLKRFRTGILFTAPTLFAFTTVMIVPFLYGLYLTFTNWDGIATTLTYVGFENYRSVFEDKAFWISFLLTLKYVIASVMLINVVAFLLAYTLTSGLKGQKFFRAGFFIPNLIGGILLGLVWQFIFSNLMVFIGKQLNLSFIENSWLVDPDKALGAMVIVTVWQFAGYMMIIYIAGLMSVPNDILEAASIDGANKWVTMRAMILPMIVPSIIICVFLSLQRTFMVYDVNLSLTAGGPYGSTELISMHVFRKAFLSRDYGVGQAEAFVLFLLVATITFLQVYFSKKKEVEA